MARKKLADSFANRFCVLFIVFLMTAPATNALSDEEIQQYKDAESRPRIDYAKKGDEHLKLKRYKEAADDYKKAIEETYSYAPYYATLAGIQLNLGDYQGAVGSYLHFLQDDPKTHPIFEIVMLLGTVAIAVPLVICFSKWFGAGAIFQIAAVTFLLLATMQNSWDDDSYMLLKFLVCPVAAFTTQQLISFKKKGFAWFLGVTAVLFNPIFRVQLESQTWPLLDLGAAILIAASLVILHLHRRRQRALKSMPEQQPPQRSTIEMASLVGSNKN